jgi:hypothetical protein
VPRGIVTATTGAAEDVVAPHSFARAKLRETAVAVVHFSFVPLIGFHRLHLSP